VRTALATPSGDDEWSAYSNALGRKFLRLDEFLKPATPASAPESAQPTDAKSQARESVAAASAKPEAPSLLRKLFS